MSTRVISEFHLSFLFRHFIFIDNIDAIKILNELAVFQPNNIHIWLEIGHVNLFLGDPTGAYLAFQKARAIDPDCHQYMDQYAAILKSQSKLADLNKLSHELLRVNDKRPEGWIALARYAESKGQLDRALAFCDKVYNVNFV